ncbi:MAG TPA: sulfite dehydrogenase [Xanthobacteraceae bacterium]|jgi:sulfane dehydrogenase subunit SoxC
MTRFSRNNELIECKAEKVAGNGLLHRRALLGRSAALAGALSTGVGLKAAGAAAEPLAEPAWGLAPGDPVPAYQTPSKFAANVVRTLSNPNFEPRTSQSRAPHQLLDGMITPNGVFFTIVHDGVPEIDPSKHQLLIHGLVKRPLIFTYETLLRYPMTSRVAFIECGGNSAGLFSPQPLQADVQELHGLVSCAEWTGIKLSTLLEETGIDSTAKWFIGEGGDAAHVMRSVPLAKGLDDTIIALYQNGEPLMPGNGYPMRLLLPGYEGNMNIKYLRRIKLLPEAAFSYWESQTYTEPLPSGKAYQFYFVNEVKSFITKPSPGFSLQKPGLYEISGVAYSGKGRISKVMVSADGGQSWAEAALQEPVLSMAFTRFRVPWQWNGGPAILQSRAWDEDGNAQPTRAEFVAQRGQLSSVPPLLAFENHHFNAITSWGVDRKGVVTHVYA